MSTLRPPLPPSLREDYTWRENQRRQTWPLSRPPCHPPSGKTTLAEGIQGDRHNHSVDPDAFDYYHFNVSSDEVWDALNNPPTTDLDRYILRLSNALTDMVSRAHRYLPSRGGEESPKGRDDEIRLMEKKPPSRTAPRSPESRGKGCITGLPHHPYIG